MELKHILDIRDKQDLSDLYVIICYNTRSAAYDFTLRLNPEAHQRLKLFNTFREGILKYCYDSGRIDCMAYEYLLTNSYEFVTDKRKNLRELVDILKE